MATIIKRKKKYSVVYYYDDEKGEKRQKWETYNTSAEAKRRKAEVENQQIQGTFIPPQDVLVKDFLYDFVKIYGTNHWALSTYQSNCALIANYINPIIGNLPIQSINAKSVDEYYQTLKKTKSVVRKNRKPKSEYVTDGVINSIHKVLRCAFDQAVKWELIGKNPFPLANRPKTEYKKRDIWDSATIRIALDGCKDPKLYIAMNLAFACSMRSGEISGLQWPNVHISDSDIAADDAYVIIDKELARVSKDARQLLDEKDIIQVFPSMMNGTSTNLVLKKPKTDSSIRKVWLPKTLAYILRKWKKEQDEVKSFFGNEYYDYNLVVTLPNGRPCENRVIEKEFNKLKERLNLPNVVFHSLRHSSTTYKLKLNNGDIKATQGDTGHSQIDMITDVYAHILDEDRKVNAQKFEEAFYANCDLRTVTPPGSKESPELNNIVQALKNSPELTSMLSNLIAQAAASSK
ncbi:MAG: site-specific integrase [Eubacteriales bacterium]|nr:site-specific integrase [Eubacteriales bacterium]